MSQEYYWLGPGVFKKIKPDDRIPDAVIEEMSQKRLESLIAEKKIGYAPRSAILKQVADNARAEIDSLNKKGEKLISKYEKKIEAERRETSKYKDRLKDKIKEYKELLRERDSLLKRLTVAEQKAKQAWEKAEQSIVKFKTDREEALDSLKESDRQCRELSIEKAKLIKENAGLKKSMKKLSKAK